MKPQQGRRTGAFGQWLTNYLAGQPKYSDYFIYYDHGDARSASNVVETKGFFGKEKEVSNKNRLAGVDVMVAKPSAEIVLLIEIEERPVTPKKLLGDVLAIMMCNCFAVKEGSEQKYFEITPETQLVLAGVVPTKGYRLEKIEKVISSRLQQFTAPTDSIDPRNVIFVFAGELSQTIDRLEKIIEAKFSR